MDAKIEHDAAVKRTGWAKGPWDNEPDRLQWKDQDTGYPCLIVRNITFGGNLCGYVAVNPDHPLYGKDYDFAEDNHPISVHGGLTYSDKCQGRICHVPDPGDPDNVWWFGFDCAHSGDLLPRWIKEEPVMVFKDDTYKTIDYVREEVTNLAKQLASIATSKMPLAQQPRKRRIELE